MAIIVAVSGDYSCQCEWRLRKASSTLATTIAAPGRSRPLESPFSATIVTGNGTVTKNGNKLLLFQ